MRRELTELSNRDGTPRERKVTEADVVVCLFSKFIERDICGYWWVLSGFAIVRV
jgi:hypothetical protein